ncbi:Uncharacterised protein [Klebsiella michiganensis]|nr:Uncharacterised protein [Klebsiella michiganensis]
MRVQRPVFTDFALQAELFAVGRQQQFDGGGVKADPVVQGLHLMLGVDAFNRHHCHQDMFLLNQARIAGKQRLDKERFIRDDHVVNPRTGDIHARQIALVIDQFVNLRNNDAVMERGGFHQRRGIFGARPGVQVALAVGFVTGDQRDVWRQVDVQARVKLDVGVDSADFQQAIFQQLRNTQALGTGEGEIKLAGDTFFEEVQMLAAPDARHNHMQVVNFLWVNFRQHPREEISLFLVVAFQHHPVAGGQQLLKNGDQLVGGDHFARDLRLGQSPLFFRTATVPDASRRLFGTHY